MRGIGQIEKSEIRHRGHFWEALLDFGLLLEEVELLDEKRLLVSRDLLHHILLADQVSGYAAQSRGVALLLYALQFRMQFVHHYLAINLPFVLFRIMHIRKSWHRIKRRYSLHILTMLTLRLPECRVSNVKQTITVNSWEYLTPVIIKWTSYSRIIRFFTATLRLFLLFVYFIELLDKFHVLIGSHPTVFSRVLKLLELVICLQLGARSLMTLFLLMTFIRERQITSTDYRKFFIVNALLDLETPVVYCVSYYLFIILVVVLFSSLFSVLDNVLKRIHQKLPDFRLSQVYYFYWRRRHNIPLGNLLLLVIWDIIHRGRKLFGNMQFWNSEPHLLQIVSVLTFVISWKMLNLRHLVICIFNLAWIQFKYTSFIDIKFSAKDFWKLGTALAFFTFHD